MSGKIVEKKLFLSVICGIIGIALPLAALRQCHGDAGLIPLEHTGGAALPFRGGFALVSASGVTVCDRRGEILFAENAALTPEKSAAGDTLLALAAGEEIRLYDSGGLRAALEPEGAVLALAMAGDTLAVARAGTDYPCHVTFYDGETPRFRRYIASGICRSIALDGAGGACLALETELMFLRGAEESARIPLPGVLAVYAAGGGFCARTAEALHFYSRTGAEWGVYDGPFTLVQVFDGLLCARVPAGIAAFDGRGRAVHEYALAETAPVAFGAGDVPAVLLGETALALDKRLAVQIKIENDYVPADIITNGGTVTILWPRGAQVFGK
jgi:hypothetical protein